MKIITATPEMLKDHCPGKVSSQALAAVDGDELIGIAGIYVQDASQVIFSWVGPMAKKNPRHVITVANKIMAMAQSRKLPIFALCDVEIPKSEMMLLHYGFVPYAGNIWKYEGRA